MLARALTIAGSDVSGAAGMEADLKTFEEFGVYGMVALTVIVAQDPDTWAHNIYPMDLELIEKQIQTVAKGIPPEAMKTGMLGSAALVDLVRRSIEEYKLKNVVIDPVMVCKGIDELMIPESAAAIKEQLVSHAHVITPNTVEAAYLADMDPLKTEDDIKEAATRIFEKGAKNVIIKSGSRIPGEHMIDVLYDGKEYTVVRKPKHQEAFTSGAGCTFSAAMTACLAKGLTVKEAFAQAQDFIDAAVGNSFRLNQFHGALAHCAHRLKK